MYNNYIVEERGSQTFIVARMRNTHVLQSRCFKHIFSSGVWNNNNQSNMINTIFFIPRSVTLSQRHRIFRHGLRLRHCVPAATSFSRELLPRESIYGFIEHAGPGWWESDVLASTQYQSVLT